MKNKKYENIIFWINIFTWLIRTFGYPIATWLTMKTTRIDVKVYQWLSKCYPKTENNTITVTTSIRLSLACKLHVFDIRKHHFTDIIK